MSKDVVVNGENYSGVSIVQLMTAMGTSALFKDVDEISSLPNIAEITSGTFTVDAASMGNIDSSRPDYIGVPHGMTNVPDGWVVLPMYWYDTQDANFALAVYDGKNDSHIALGRRSVESNTTHVGQALATSGSYADSTNIYPMGTVYAKFMPTYIDDDGNEGQQVYIWIAWKLAE